MKILYHHRTLGDGAEGIHIAEMVAAFRDLGHEVQVSGLAAGDRGEGRRGRIEGLRARVPAVLFELAAMASNLIEYVAVRRQIAVQRPDFVYKRHARFDVAALLAARHAGVPSVLEVNCVFDAEGYRAFEPMALAGASRWLERMALRMASVRLAVSTPLARQIEQLAGRAAVVLPNGADPRRFDAAAARPETVRQQFGLHERFVVGWTGVLRDWHGLDLLLAALAGVPDAMLLIVGDGPARWQVEARAAELGVGHRIVITGRVPHDVMPAYIAAMDVAVVAHDRTGVASPMKLLEYMAMGRAVVAPRLDNIQDVIADTHDGLLFAPDQAGDLEMRLRALQADAGLRGRLGAAARAKIESSRNWHANAKEVLHLLRAKA